MSTPSNKLPELTFNVSPSGEDLICPNCGEGDSLRHAWKVLSVARMFPGQTPGSAESNVTSAEMIWNDVSEEHVFCCECFAEWNIPNALRDKIEEV